ncbi:hypothetical protein RQP46_005355 [Phenoliferia psychrophenolica]
MTSPATLPPYVRPAPTREDLDYAPLAALDFSKFDKPGGKNELVADLRAAIDHVGFFYVKNSGISDADVLRQLALGQAFFALPLEEKLKHSCDFSIGRYFGYRPSKDTYGDTGVRSQIQMLNQPKLTPSLAAEEHDWDLIRPHREEVQAFQQQIHDKILSPLLKLFALLLELPENYLADPHAFEKATEDHLRYMQYIPNTAEEYEKINHQSVRGHTDFGLLTILFPQIVNGLQVQTAPGEYKYVKYIEDHVVVNTAEVLTYITAGHIKSTVHRVVRPVPDQSHVNRLGVLYFSRAGNDFPITVVPSPLLERLGLYDPAKADPSPPTGLEWGRARVKHTHDKVVVEHVGEVKPFVLGSHKINLTYDSPAPAPLRNAIAT